MKLKRLTILTMSRGSLKMAEIAESFIFPHELNPNERKQSLESFRTWRKTNDLSR